MAWTSTVRTLMSAGRSEQCTDRLPHTAASTINRDHQNGPQGGDEDL